MSEGLSFENNNGSRIPGYDRFADASKTPLISRLLIRVGVAKDEKQARKVSIWIIVILVAASLLILFVSTRPPKIRSIHLKVKPPAEIRAAPSSEGL